MLDINLRGGMREGRFDPFCPIMVREWRNSSALRLYNIILIINNYIGEAVDITRSDICPRVSDQKGRAGIIEFARIMLHNLEFADIYDR